MSAARRLFAAQAIMENMAIVSNDEKLSTDAIRSPDAAPAKAGVRSGAQGMKRAHVRSWVPALRCAAAGKRGAVSTLPLRTKGGIP